MRTKNRLGKKLKDKMFHLVPKIFKERFFPDFPKSLGSNFLSDKPYFDSFYA